MAATNAVRNVKTCTIDGVTVTSVLGLNWDSNTQFIRDGSDNDASFTLTIARAKECNGTVRFRDPVQAQLVASKTNVTGVFVFKAEAGTDRTCTILNMSTGQAGGEVVWDERLGEFRLAFSGGTATIT